MKLSLFPAMMYSDVLMRGMALFFGTFILTVAADESSASAGHSITLVGSADGCPSTAAVAAALRGIFPDVTVAADGQEEGLRVELWDAGATYRVVSGTVRRELTDAAIRCEERARKAAVLVALVLEPPTVEVPAVPPVAQARLPSVQLEVGGVFDAAPRSGSNSLFSGGAQLRLFVGTRYVGGVLGIAGLVPTTLDLGPARARLSRVPIDLAVRGQLRRGRWGLSLDVGAVITVQITDGVDVALSLQETRIEVGIRMAAKLEYWAWNRFAPFVALQGEGVPLPYELVLPGAGVVGTTPQFWVGGVLGLVARLR